jgi:hypothetical protein
MALTSESKLKDLVKHQEFMDLLDQYIPGFAQNPRLKMGYPMKFKDLLPYLDPETKSKIPEITAAVDALNLPE